MSKIKCNCPCHQPGSNLAHIKPCCVNGYIDFPDTPSTLSPEIGEGPPAISEDYMKWLESKKPTYYKGEWLFSDWAYGAKTAYVHFQKEISRLKEEAHAYRSALQEIEDPTKFIQSRSDKEGKPMDGQRALKLSFDPVYLRGIATKAMKEYLKEKIKL